MPGGLYKLKNALRMAVGCAMLFACIQTRAQKKIDIDGEATAYVSLRGKNEVSGLGIISIYNKKSFCQLRYNYEDTRTFSFFWGKPIVKQKKDLYLQVVPTIGLSAGNFMGVSPGFQLYSEYKNFEFFNSSQTSICVTNVNRSFFFSWSEALYKVKNILRLGIAFQYTKQYPTIVRKTELSQPPNFEQIDLGPMLGVQYWRFYVSGYFFNVWDAKRHYAVSLTYNFK